QYTSFHSVLGTFENFNVTTDKMVHTELMITEKPSLAKSLVKALAPYGKKINEQYKRGLPIYSFTREYRGSRHVVKFISTTGRYQDWNTDPAKLFTTPLENQEASSGNVFENLKDELEGNEGEYTIFQIIDLIDEMKKTKTLPTNFLRAKFSEITRSKIQEAYENLVLPNKNESLSVQALKEFDLRESLITRIFLYYFNGKHGNPNFHTISYGPCQIPALSFCVDRNDEIQRFISQPCWDLSITVAKRNGRKVILNWKKNEKNIDDITMLQLQNRIKKCKKARVKHFYKTITTKHRPDALNMVEMLEYCSLELGIGPYAAMSIAEKLYEKGYITNPRTNTTIYSKNFDFDSRLESLSGHNEWGSYTKELLKNKLNRPTGHTIEGIVPVKLARAADLSEEQQKLYNYITRHFLGSLSSDIELEEKLIIVEIEDESFEWLRVLKPGFTKIMDWRKIDEVILSDFKEHEVINIISVELIEEKKRPPEYLKESELIKLMGKCNIGTQHSIPTHIENICKRNYVMVQGANRYLVPTDLEKIDPDLSDPKERNKIELKLRSIANGADYKEVLKPILKSYANKFKTFRKQIATMDKLIKVTLSSYATSEKILSECVKCQKKNKTWPTYLECSACKKVYSHPYMKHIEPIDGRKVEISTSPANTVYSLCVYCLYPPKINELEGLVKYCDHNPCIHSLINNGVCKCPMECGGQIVLDTTSSGLDLSYLSTHHRPNNHDRWGLRLSGKPLLKWKLSCENNNCFEILFLDDVIGVSILNGKFCDNEDCISQLLRLETSKQESLEGCILCDEHIYPLYVKITTLTNEDEEFTKICTKANCSSRKIK
ncbi:6246_t:CDS:10, partial [Cetraspora pellucida]